MPVTRNVDLDVDVNVNMNATFDVDVDAIDRRGSSSVLPSRTMSTVAFKFKFRSTSTLSDWHRA
jgi:hypothetical protein